MEQREKEGVGRRGREGRMRKKRKRRRGWESLKN